MYSQWIGLTLNKIGLLCEIKDLIRFKLLKMSQIGTRKSKTFEVSDENLLAVRQQERHKRKWTKCSSAAKPKLPSNMIQPEMHSVNGVNPVVKLKLPCFKISSPKASCRKTKRRRSFEKGIKYLKTKVCINFFEEN